MMTKRELFNAKNSGKKIEKDMTIDVVSVGTFDDTDKDGNPVKATALVAKDGNVYTCISSTVAGSVELLSEILQEEGTVTVKVVEGVSNSGRTFKQLQII